MRTYQNTQSIAIQVLEALKKTKLTNNDRAEIISEGFAQIEKKYLNFDNLATKSDIKETELKLTKEIEMVRLETKNLEVKLINEIAKSGLKLTKEIEMVRLETKNLEVKLINEIAKITNEISQSGWKTIKWMIGLVIAIIIPIMIAIISLILMK